MKLGFTGTRKGLTQIQTTVLANFLCFIDDDFNTLLQGQCIGADYKSCLMAKDKYWSIESYPPTDKRFVHNFKCDIYHDEKPYLERNKLIVENSDYMVCCPKEMEEQLRGGTWYTIRYTKWIDKPHTIIYPNGDRRDYT